DPGEVVTIVGQGPNNEGALRSENGNNTVTTLAFSGGARITTNTGSTLNLPGTYTLPLAEVIFDGAGNTNVTGILTDIFQGTAAAPGLVAGSLAGDPNLTAAN